MHQEDGTRFVYVVPDAATGDIVPLRVDPKPDALMRVMVGAAIG